MAKVEETSVDLGDPQMQATADAMFDKELTALNTSLRNDKSPSPIVGGSFYGASGNIRWGLETSDIKEGDVIQDTQRYG